MNRRKRGSECSSTYSSDFSLKKLNMDVVGGIGFVAFGPVATFESSAGLGTFGPNLQLEKNIIEFINKEVEYYQEISLVTSVYRSVLDTSYENLFTTSEMNLIFEDIRSLSNCSKQFLFSIFNNLNNNTPTKLDNMSEIDFAALIYKCQGKIEIGTLFNTHLLDVSRYRKSISNLKVKYDFIKELVDNKSKQFPMIDKWISESQRLVNVKTNFFGLLMKPLDRLNNYPYQLKRIMDLVDDQFDLNISLVKLNKLIEQVWNLPKVTNWEELRDYNITKVDERVYNNNLELVTEENQLRGTRGIDQGIDQGINQGINQSTKQYSNANGSVSQNILLELTKKLNTKYHHLQSLDKSLKTYSHKIIKFGAVQLTYSKAWFDSIKDDPMICLLFNKYMEKMNNLMIIIENFTFQLNGVVLNRLARGLQIVSECKKQKSITKLIKTINLIDELIILVMVKFNDLNRKWIKAFIGESKINEFQLLRNQSNDNTDIIQFYNCLNRFNVISDYPPLSLG